MSLTAQRTSPSASSEPPVVVVGGGLSGLAAAVELTSLRIPVLLLEQKNRLGGRAYSFVDTETGDAVDNGQHVMIVGYERTLRFLARIGTRHLVTIQKQPLLYLHHPKRGLCEFRLPALPPPFHLIAGILLTNLLSFGDKLRLLRAGWALQHNRVPRELTIEQWLDSLMQSNELKRAFWEPLAISIMNEHIGRASASVFVNALRHAFLAASNNAALVLPRVGLSALFADAAQRFLERAGAQLRLNADVVAVECRADEVTAVRLRDGKAVACSAAILAVPHYEAGSLLPESLRDEALESMHSVPNTPIVSIHLWFKEDVMKYDFVGLIDRRVQWVFDRRRITMDRKGAGHVSCVISGADEFLDLSNEELVRIAVEDLRTLHRRVSEPLHALVIREKRATFSCTPQAERLRPAEHTRARNLFLAGDWTDTGLPATIEGAIVSGERCAHLAARTWNERRVR